LKGLRALGFRQKESRMVIAIHQVLLLPEVCGLGN
jgi:hypothetical protein